MKVVFSRKGFDSQYGKMASPILPDGRLLPLPIPSRNDRATVADLNYSDVDTPQLIADLSGGAHSISTCIHLDPDLDRAHSSRLSDWRPSLGQTGAAQSHLRKRGIAPSDLFLFFGWFRQTELAAGRWRFARGAPDLHVLFGWLEVAEVLQIVTGRDEALARHPWIANHPHVASPQWYDDKRNTLYVAPPRSSLAAGDKLGGGLFQLMSPALQLTKPGSTRSEWSLPSWFLPSGRPPLSFHPNPKSWRAEDGSVTLRSAGKGQEFVIDGDLYPELGQWAGNLVKENA